MELQKPRCYNISILTRWENTEKFRLESDTLRERSPKDALIKSYKTPVYTKQRKQHFLLEQLFLEYDDGYSIQQFGCVEKSVVLVVQTEQQRTRRAVFQTNAQVVGSNHVDVILYNNLKRPWRKFTERPSPWDSAAYLADGDLHTLPNWWSSHDWSCSLRPENKIFYLWYSFKKYSFNTENIFSGWYLLILMFSNAME